MIYKFVKIDINTILNNNTKKQIEEMFCNLCFNANRSNYNKHSLRDFAGNTICPYLLSIKCLTCGQPGHTPKYCKNIFKTSLQINDLPKNKPVTKYMTVKTQKKKYKNNFMCLSVNDEEEQDEYAYLYPENIIWGVGFKDTLGIKWGDIM